MMNADVAARQKRLSEEFQAYLAGKTDVIAAKEVAVEAKGAVEAADRDDAIEHARRSTVAEGRFEAQHQSDDKAPINFLERGLRAGRAVCRLVDYNRTHLGCGFLIAPGLLITNNHVLPDAETAGETVAEFDFELDADEQPRRVHRFQIDATIFVTSPQDQRDFTIVGVRPVSEAGAALAERGWLPLDGLRHKILEGQPTIVLQHPNGAMKQICLFESTCTFRDDAEPYILYTNDTDFGSSGSPVFNRHWQVVALHHASVETDRIWKGRPEINNRGIRISQIIAALETGDTLTAGAGPMAAGVRNVLDSPVVQRDGRPAPGRPLASGDDEAVALEGRWTNVKVKPVGPRDGYDAGFLGAGFELPIDKVVPDWLASDVTPLSDGGGRELKYQHFSIVMSKSRKLPYFTAVNIKGDALLALGRKDRDPDHPLEPGVRPEAAADVWYYDDRIPVDDQLGPRLYDLTSFDFGHLVRRMDPVWSPGAGDLRTPRIANDDTFYMTNGTPQEVRWHRQTPLTEDQANWSALEDEVLGVINRGDERASVFTGPVLDPRDPKIRDVAIPRAFWKIVAHVVDRRLQAHGFLLWQTREVATAKVTPEGPWTFPASVQPTKIRDIARVAGLDFGRLFDADVKA